MPDLTAKTFAGVRNTLPAERLKPEDLVEAVNVDLDDSGRPSRRGGQVTHIAGNVHSLWSDGVTCLYVSDGGMYSLFPDFSTKLVALGLSEAPMAYLSVNERIYHSDGRRSGVFDGGAVRSWGIPLDALPLTATTTSGALPAGVYQMAMTLIRNDGQESGTGLALRLDLPENSGITFSWPTDDLPAGVVDVALYLTAPDGAILMQAVVVDVLDGATTYRGGARSLPLATQWFDAPPAGQCLAHYRGRIYIAVGAELFATTALGYEWCDLRDFLPFDGTRINLVAAVDNGLFIGTERAVYFAGGQDFGGFTVTVKLDGAAVAGSLVTGDGQKVTGRAELAGVAVVMFATSAGIVVGLPDGSLNNLTQERYLFSTGVGAAVLRHDSTKTQYLLSMALPPT